MPHLVFACGRQFIGSNGCAWVHPCTFCTVCLSACQADGLKWILTRVYRLFQKERNSPLSRFASELNVWEYIVECVFVCDFCAVCAVWYVVCNCLCLTIHHRTVFLMLSLLSSVTNFFSLLLGAKREEEKIKLFSNWIWQVFFFFFFAPPPHTPHWTKAYITNFLVRDCVGGLDEEEETSYLPSRKTIKAESTELSKSVIPLKHWGPTLGKWKTLYWHKTQQSLQTSFYTHLFSRYFDSTFNFASKMQLH